MIPYLYKHASLKHEPYEKSMDGWKAIQQTTFLLVAPGYVIKHRISCNAGAGLIKDEQVL